MTKVHLDIPFYPSRTTPGHPDGLHCQKMSIKMILSFFLPDKTFTSEQLEKITGMKPEKAAWEMQFSIWLVNNGFEVKHFAPFDYDAFKKKGTDYIREEYGDDTANWQIANSDTDTAIELTAEYMEKVQIINKKPTVQDIIHQMEAGYLLRVMVDSGVLNASGKYIGHSVVVTGYDDDSVWFHDPGLPALENRKVSRATFQKAMESFGNEMDAIKKI